MDSGNQTPWSKPNGFPAGRPETQVSVMRSSPHPRPTAAPPAPKAIPYLQLLKGHIVLIIGFVLLGAFGGAVWVIFQTPVYRASATVELLNSPQGFTGGYGGEGPGTAASNMATQVEILRSRTFLNRVLAKMSLELAPQISSPLTVFTRFRNRIPFMQRDPLVESREALSLAAGSLTAKPSGLTRLIEIDCTTTSPDVAATFVNTLIAEEGQKAQSDRATSTQQSAAVIDTQLEQAKSNLQQASEKLSEFVRKSGMDFFGQNATLADTKMASLKAEAAGMLSSLITKKNILETARSTSPENLPDVINDPGLMQLKSTIMGLQRDRAGLLKTFQPADPKVQKLDAQIEALKKTSGNKRMPRSNGCKANMTKL